jgi:DNA-binding transcriptional LysR family regulator
MDVRGVNLNLLSALDALLEQRNVTRAARRAGLSQPAMSHTLAQLRALFDDPLLTRDGLLTPLAETVRAQLREGLGALQQVLQTRQHFEPATAQRTFRIAVSDALQIAALHRLYAAIAARAPQVDLVLRSPRQGSFEALARGELDLIVGSQEQSPGGLASSCELYREQLVCIARRDHPQLRARLTLARFCSLLHALVSEDELPGYLDRVLAEHGRSRRVAVRMPDYAGLGHFIAGSELLASVPARLAHTLAERLPLRVMPVPLALPQFPVSMFWHPRQDTEPGHRWLRERIQDAL